MSDFNICFVYFVSLVKYQLPCTSGQDEIHEYSRNQHVCAEVFEEVLEIVSYMTFYSPTISMDMWTLWPLLTDALSDWAIDFFSSKYMKVPILPFYAFFRDFMFFFLKM